MEKFTLRLACVCMCAVATLLLQYSLKGETRLRSLNNIKKMNVRSNVKNTKFRTFYIVGEKNIERCMRRRNKMLNSMMKIMMMIIKIFIRYRCLPYARVHCLKEIGEFFWLLLYSLYQSLKSTHTSKWNEKKSLSTTLTQANRVAHTRRFRREAWFIQKSLEEKKKNIKFR